MSEETFAKINDLRRRVVNGEEVSEEELRDAITALAQFRGRAVEAAEAKAAKKTTRKKSTTNSALLGKQGEDLLNSLDFK